MEKTLGWQNLSRVYKINLHILYKIYFFIKLTTDCSRIIFLIQLSQTFSTNLEKECFKNLNYRLMMITNEILMFQFKKNLKDSYDSWHYKLTLKVSEIPIRFLLIKNLLLVDPHPQNACLQLLGCANKDLLGLCSPIY